jgi:hypothetical protein
MELLNLVAMELAFSFPFKSTISCGQPSEQGIAFPSYFWVRLLSGAGGILWKKAVNNF